MFENTYNIIQKLKRMNDGSGLIEELQTAIKFRIQDNDRDRLIFCESQVKKFIGTNMFFKLPYDHMLFEFSSLFTDSIERPHFTITVSNYDSKDVLKKIQSEFKLSNDDELEILSSEYLHFNVMYILKDSRLYNYSFVIPKYDYLFLDREGGIVCNRDIVLFSSSVMNSILFKGRISSDPALVINLLNHFSKYIYIPIAESLLQINCSNVRVHKFQVPSSALSKRQLKPKELQFFKYHIIDLGRQYDTIRNISEAKACIGTAADRAMYSVRGHFKNIKGRLFWWSPHVRGRAVNGVVEKDYNVK